MSVSKEKVLRLASLEENPSVHQIRGRMATLLDYFEDEERYSSYAPFMYVYHSVTSSVADYMIEDDDFFDNPDALENLDAEFAELYFRPLRENIENDRRPEPWKTYFDYCSRDKTRPAVEMLLGINAHINADLLHALHSQNYSERQDYQRINRILEKQLQDAMIYLARRHDLAGLFGFMDRRMAYREFQRLVVNWRENTWESYQEIKEDDFEAHKHEIYSQTEEVAEEIVKLEEDFNYLNLYSTIRKANRLEVKL